MNTFIVFHHYKNNPNISTPLNSYITHPTWAGPGGPLDHRGVPQGQDYCHWGYGNISCSTAYHNYCQIRNGHRDYLSITFKKKKKEKKKRFYSLSPPPMSHALSCHLLPPLPLLLPPLSSFLCSSS